MDQGPVLVITFNAQQIMAVRSSTGAVVEGDPVSDKQIMDSKPFEKMFNNFNSLQSEHYFRKWNDTYFRDIIIQ